MDNICERCGHKFNDITNFRRHLLRKKTCEATDSTTTIDELRRIHIPPKKEKGFKCKTCAKGFASRSGLHAHSKKCNAIKTTTNIDIDILRQQLRDEILHEVQTMIGEASNVTINNNIVNNTVIGLNVTINSYGDEDISYLTPELLTFCIKNPRKGMQSLIENIHFHPNHAQNHNIRCKSLKDNVFEKCIDNEWRLCDASNTLDELIRKGYKILNTHYTENVVNDINVNEDETTQRVYEKFRFLSDTTCNEYYAVKRDLRLIVKDRTMYLLELQQGPSDDNNQQSTHT